MGQHSSLHSMIWAQSGLGPGLCWGSRGATPWALCCLFDESGWGGPAMGLPAPSMLWTTPEDQHSMVGEGAGPRPWGHRRSMGSHVGCVGGSWLVRLPGEVGVPDDGNALHHG